MSTEDPTFERLHAYYDGELSAWARFWFERRLRRDAGLQRELAALEDTSTWIRESQRAVPEVDLWEGIAARLPAEPAPLEDDLAELAPARSGWLPGWLRPLPAGALATAALALAIAFGLLQSGPAPGGVVRSLDAQGHRVMVLPADGDATVIWVFDEGVETSRRFGHDDRA